MSDAHSRIASTREEAHAAITQAYQMARSLLADGKRVKISVGEDSDPITVKQRGFLHRAVFPQISEQVRVGGERFVPDVWKEYFRNLFLGSKFVKMGEHVIEIRNSTEDLNVQKYSAYIDRVIAHASTEWHVAFVFDERERESVRYVRPARAKEAETC